MLLTKFARALMTVRRMRPGLAIVDALAAVIEDADAVERLAHSHAWSATRLSLAAFFDRAIGAVADERRLRAVAEQGLAHARGLLDRQGERIASLLAADALIDAMAVQRDSLDAEARKLRALIAEAGFQLECSAVGPNMPRREAGLLAQVKAETDYQIKLLERIDRLSAAIHAYIPTEATQILEPGDLASPINLPRKTHDAT